MQGYFRCTLGGVALLIGSTQATAQCVVKPVMTAEDIDTCRSANESESVVNARPEIRECGQLLEKYGQELLGAIVDLRGNQITAYIKGQTKQVFGVPRSEFVTAQTICADLKLLNATPVAFERVIMERRDRLAREHRERAAALERSRLQQEQKRLQAAEERAVRVAEYQAIPEAQRILEAQVRIKDVLKDPDSAQFRNVQATETAVCGEVNARNGFGGYNGFKGFVVAYDAMALDTKDTAAIYLLLAVRSGCKG